MRKGERERVRREKGKRLRPACLSGEKKKRKRQKGKGGREGRREREREH